MHFILTWACHLGCFPCSSRWQCSLSPRCARVGHPVRGSSAGCSHLRGRPWFWGTQGTGIWQAPSLLWSTAFGDSASIWRLCQCLGPRLCLWPEFMPGRLMTVGGFNSTILLFVFSLSRVLSSHFPFFPNLWDWVIFMIPFYFFCWFIGCNSFKWLLWDS